MKNIDKENFARIHSIETFGTVDGPRYKICYLYARMCLKMQILPQ